MAAISYDSPEILKSFTERHGITYPLLSDAGSATIDAWGIRNREATGRTAGIPHPGTFVIDRNGLIVSRSFEAAYQERRTAASILAGDASSPARAEGSPAVSGKHLQIRLSQSDRVAAPGQRVTLIMDVTPGRNIHVYAPEQQGYIPINVRLDASADFKTSASRYPSPRDYVFAPLNERVKVFDRPFRIFQDVTLTLTPALRQRALAKATLTVTGTLDYQACDDRVCFPPDNVALTWTLGLTPIER